MNAIRLLMEEANILMEGAELIDRSISTSNTPRDIRKMCTALGIRLAVYRLYDTIDLLTNMEPAPSDEEPMPF